jgi:glucosamine-6-phosphate deaminase
MDVRVVADDVALASAAAGMISERVRAQPDILILAATGQTPMGCYAELARRASFGDFDSSRLGVAQLDEYLAVDEHDPRSLFGWTRRALLEPLTIGPERTIRLIGDEPDPEMACRAYDAEIAAAGGIDLAVLGLGANGHLGFNEPPTDADAPTGAVRLTPESLESNARYWPSASVPREALTCGMNHIVAARQVILLVSGAHKASILGRVMGSAPDPWLPATWLHNHPNATLVADRAAMEAS